jgi:hypothetical protein
MKTEEFIARLIDSKAINGEEAMCLTNAMSPKLVYTEPYKPTNTTPFFNPNNTSNAGIDSSASTINLNEIKEQVIIDGWIARDEDNMIYIFDEKPHKSEIEWHCGSLGSTMLIKKMLFPEVKWKDRKPTQVKLIIEKV